MVEWAGQHREALLLVLAASAVVFPLLLGAALGHLPRAILLRWALPLGVATILLAAGIRLAGEYLSPAAHLAFSSVFALLWISAGAYILRGSRALGRPLPPHAARAARWMGVLLLLFGLLWLSLACYRFSRA